MENHVKDQQLKIRSALDHYDGFSGWQSRDLESTDNILKLFRNNLNQYEVKYKEKQQSKTKKRVEMGKHNEKNEKQNEGKLPSIPLRQDINRKGSFLALRNRNILKEAIDNVQNQKKQVLIIHQMVQKLKKGDSLDKKSKQVKEMKLIKQLKGTCQARELNHIKTFLKSCQEIPLSQTCCLRQKNGYDFNSNQTQSIKLNKLQDIHKWDYEFSDEMMMLGKYRRAGKDIRGEKMLVRNDNKENK